jgi:glutamate dehydrogenase
VVSESAGINDRESFLEGLVTRTCERVAEAPGALPGFARVYLRRVPDEYLQRRDHDALCAQVVDLFEFVETRRNDAAAVRIFTPTVEEHGYAADGAVVEVVTPDSPFLIDSVINAIGTRGLDVDWVIHPVIGTERNGSGKLTAVGPARTASQRESIQHYELAEPITEEAADELAGDLYRVLSAVKRTVSDFERMQGAIYRMIKLARDAGARYEREEIDEAVSFLEWLLDDNFVFLGYREYQIDETPGGEMISITPGSGLGILSQDSDSRFAEPVAVSDLPPVLWDRYETGYLLVMTKTNNLSPVHRSAKMDYIGLRRINAEGKVVGEARLLGLFTSKAYMTPADRIPVLRKKLQRVLEIEDTIEGSHYHKQIVQIFNSFPKEDLLATPSEGIRESVVGLIQSQEHEGVRLFIQRDLLQRNVSIVVVVPRDRFNAQLRKDLQQFFVEQFNGTSVDYTLSLGETDTARIHFTVWVGEGEVPDVAYEDLEAEVAERTRTWEERVEKTLRARLGDAEGRRLAELWAGRFPRYYQASVALDLAAGDIERLDELRSGSGAPVVGLQNDEPGDEQLTRLAVYRRSPKLELSDIMPTLEDLGLRVVEEVPTRLASDDGDYFIHDFGVLDTSGEVLELGESSERLARTIGAVLEGSHESDSLNRLVLTSDLHHEKIEILRAYRTYWQRVSPGFTVEYVNDAFSAHPQIASALVSYFEARFDVARSPDDADEISARILASLEDVASLDQDRILRGFHGLVGATVRTNAFRESGRRLSFKFRSAEVPAMPAPAPLYEIFVYAPDVEGVHLRGGPVARGGIRWSTRQEDYRTEVLGLMKAQMTKNAVIVPTGSKGGFVLRRPPLDRAEMRAAVQSAYVTFIRGLLDVTDNLVDGKVVHPEGVVVYDEGDPYLVVAADKGTATFSDTANAIAAEYGFWLGDAFASGGSAGYDHKALGITARGAWESVKWHLHELGVDAANKPISVVGIGDMSGDVFGNGVLISKRLRLIAAFDHRHVFIDPEPDPETSWEERRRLYNSPDSTWAAYNTDLLSPGGGVYERSAKRIELSPQARAALDVEEGDLTPAAVIRAILKAPVDLLWNGGIGTFVKAAAEKHDDADDRSNDAVRVDAVELRCRVIGEGGNLGLTQDARIEYARNGGRVNTDFIDNSGGVNCSDREVNLKVLLGVAEERGEIDRDGRDVLVKSVVEDVVAKILYDNFLQSQILSQEVEASSHRLETYEEVMAVLEAEGSLRRDLEHLPSTEDLTERARLGEGMTSPELAVLLAYSKRSLRDWLLDSDLPDSALFEQDLAAYFPGPVVERFGHLLASHPLRRELVATIVANEIVNSQGIAFVMRLMAETGAPPDRIVTAYRTARVVTDAAERWQAVEDLFGSISLDRTRELLGSVDDLVEDVARWYLTYPESRPTHDEIPDTVVAFRELGETIAKVGPKAWRDQRDAEAHRLVAGGVPPEVAHRHAYQSELVHASAIIEVAAATGRSVREVAELFVMIGHAFDVDWLEDQVARFPAATRWHRRAIQVIEDDLTLLRRQLAELVLDAFADLPGARALDAYRAARPQALDRLTRFMRALAVDGVDDVASVVVAIRRIRALAGGEADSAPAK